MTNFQFITDEHLRNAIERDKKELDQCLKNQLCKSTLLLAGSIIEAILVDFFMAFPRTDLSSNKLFDANLATLLNLAEEEKLISSRTKEISTVIKNYRNLIHPGREYRLKERIDIHTANVAASLVEIIIQEIAENYAKRLGYTAEQAINKIKIDPSCTSIFPHMIDKMAPIERIKLFKAIPNLCFEGGSAGDFIDTVIESFIQLHMQLKAKIPKEILLSETCKLHDYINNATKLEAVFYFRFFVGNLNILPPEQGEVILSYLLGSLENGTEEELKIYIKWKVFCSVGTQLNNDKNIMRLIALIDKQLYNYNYEYDDLFLSILTHQIANNLDSKYLYSLVEHLQKKEWNKTALKWAEAINSCILPF